MQVVEEVVQLFTADSNLARKVAFNSYSRCEGFSVPVIYKYIHERRHGVCAGHPLQMGRTTPTKKFTLAGDT